MGTLKFLIGILLLFSVSISDAKHMDKQRSEFSYKTVIEYLEWEYLTIPERCQAKCKTFFL